MVAFLAALPAIFAAIKSTTEIFDLGKKVVEEIKGEPSGATSAADLEGEIENFSPEQKSGFVVRMKEELNVYEAITDRLYQQGGEITANILDAIPAQQRGEVALLRMTTRPWAVRWMVLAVVFPPLASVCMNMFISAYNVLNKVWAVSPQAIEMITIGSVLNELYLSMVGWASGVIMTYMGMREIGKAVGHQDGVSVSDITQTVGGMIGNIKKVFSR